RLLLARPTTTYLLGLAALSLVAPLAVLLRLRHEGMPWFVAAAHAGLVVLPAAAVGASLLHLLFARVLTPRTLPQLDLSKGVGPERRTLVVIPTLLCRPDDVHTMLRRLELHYLTNPDPNLQFALLTDEADSETERPPSTLVEEAVKSIAALNRRHGG